jgi:hypothetical protein
MPSISFRTLSLRSAVSRIAEKSYRDAESPLSIVSRIMLSTAQEIVVCSKLYDRCGFIARGTLLSKAKACQQISHFPDFNFIQLTELVHLRRELVRFSREVSVLRAPSESSNAGLSRPKSAGRRRKAMIIGGLLIAALGIPLAVTVWRVARLSGGPTQPDIRLEFSSFVPPQAVSLQKNEISNLFGTYVGCGFVLYDEFVFRGCEEALRQAITRKGLHVPGF